MLDGCGAGCPFHLVQLPDRPLVLLTVIYLVIPVVIIKGLGDGLSFFQRDVFGQLLPGCFSYCGAVETVFGVRRDLGDVPVNCAYHIATVPLVNIPLFRRFAPGDTRDTGVHKRRPKTAVVPQVHHVLHVGSGGLVGDDQGVTRLDRASGGRCRLRIYRFDFAASDEVAEELVQLLAAFVGRGVQPLQRRVLGVLQTVALVFSLDGDDVLRHLGWL